MHAIQTGGAASEGRAGNAEHSKGAAIARIVTKVPARRTTPSAQGCTRRWRTSSSSH
jgi:hypothetical protein